MGDPLVLVKLHDQADAPDSLAANLDISNALQLGELILSLRLVRSQWVRTSLHENRISIEVPFIVRVVHQGPCK